MLVLCLRAAGMGDFDGCRTNTEDRTPQYFEAGDGKTCAAHPYPSLSRSFMFHDGEILDRLPAEPEFFTKLLIISCLGFD